MTKDPENYMERVHQGKTVEDTRQVYGDWAKTYDETLTSLGYRSPWLVASIIAARISDKTAPILDVGCGTGMSGQSLSNYGFETIDGIDLSPEMLEQARAKDIYRTLTPVDLTRPIDMEDGLYGAAVSVGTFTVGHVKPDCIPEILRLIRPRGLFALTVRTDAWHDHGYDALLEKYAGQNLLTVLDNHIQSHFENQDQQAHFLLLGKN